MLPMEYLQYLQCHFIRNVNRIFAMSIPSKKKKYIFINFKDLKSKIIEGSVFLKRN